MKKLLALLLLFSLGFSISLTKTVSGPELIDINDTLQVNITISSGDAVQIEKLVDPVPEHFVAEGYPNACRQSEKELVCNFGQAIQGKMEVKYRLRAIATGYGIIGSPQLYYDGGIATIDFFRQYYIGKPKIELAVDGKTTFLPGESVSRDIVIQNTGVRALHNATLHIRSERSNQTFSISLNPQEVKKIHVDLGTAEKSGVLHVNIEISWEGGSKQVEESLLFVSPDIRVSRTVRGTWKLIEGKLQPKVVETIRITNNGTAPGNYTLSSGENFLLEPGEEKKIVKEYEKVVPAVKISLKDERGVLYTTVSFKEEQPEIRKGFFVLLYQYVASSIPFWALALMSAISLYLAVKFKNTAVRLALLTVSVVSFLLLASYLAVGAVNPLLSQTLSKSSGLLPIPLL